MNHPATNSSLSKQTAETQSPLLQLPRELRDQIYGLITTSVRVSEEDSQKVSNKDAPSIAQLVGPPQLSLLLVSRQIHDEYEERLRGGAELFVQFNRHSLQSPTYKQGAAKALKEVKDIWMNFPWLSVRAASSQDDFRAFCSRLGRNLVHHTEFENNPSNAFRVKLVALLSELRQVVHPDAGVTINIVLDGFPDVSDPFSWLDMFLPQDHNKPLSELAVRILNESVHMPTIFNIAKHASVTWPKPGKLVIRALHMMPRYCTLARNSRDLKSSREAFLQGTSDTLIKPDYDKSDEKIVVELRQTPEGTPWRDGWRVLRTS